MPGYTGTQGWRALKRRHVQRTTGADRQLVASQGGGASGGLRRLLDKRGVSSPKKTKRVDFYESRRVELDERKRVELDERERVELEKRHRRFF